MDTGTAPTLATVLRVDRRSAVLDLPDGTVLEGVVRGRLHHEHRGTRRETGPIAVGDVVRVERTGAGTASIVSVEPRRSVLLRPEVSGRWKRQVLVANPDLAVLVFAQRDPVPSGGLVDRLLFACHAGGVPVALVFNKADLPADPETAALVRLYEGLGFRVLRTSANAPGGVGSDAGGTPADGVDALRDLVRDRCCVFAGPSGAGKSSLVNRVLPGVRLRTGEISRVTGKGCHTTTAASLVRIPGGAGHVIDTPGIREFGLAEIPSRDAALHFPEFPEPGTCRFDDCRHLSEPGCAVRRAVDAGEVVRSRYDSYRAFLAELEAEEKSDGAGGERPSGGSAGASRRR